LIFKRLYRYKALQRRYEGPWSSLYETIWSLTLPRAKRISGSGNIRSSSKKRLFQHYLPTTEVAAIHQFVGAGQQCG
jgi:hypothetical protein